MGGGDGCLPPSRNAEDLLDDEVSVSRLSERRGGLRASTAVIYAEGRSEVSWQWLTPMLM